MKWLLPIIFFICSPLVAADVLVSVLPHKSIVEAIGGDRVSVDVVVPGGGDPHLFEPTAKDAQKIREAKVWFRIGEGFERRLLSAVHCETVDLRAEQDPHVWLSARELARQAPLIAKTLSELYPEWREEFMQRCAVVVARLEATDQVLRRELAGVNVLCVSHPAYGYFCRDYGIEQLPIEHHGKEPSPRQLVKLVQRAKAMGVKRIFVQPQFSSRGAIALADALGAEIVTLDPFVEDVIANLQAMGETLSR